MSNYQVHVLKSKVGEMMSSINRLKEITTQNLNDYNDCYNTKTGDGGDFWLQPPEYVNSPTTATIIFLWRYKASGKCAIAASGNPGVFGGNVGDIGGHGYFDIIYANDPNGYAGSSQVQQMTWRCYYDFHGYADVQAKILPLLPSNCQFRSVAGV
jgi:hypothetical protein